MQLESTIWSLVEKRRRAGAGPELIAEAEVQEDLVALDYALDQFAVAQLCAGVAGVKLHYCGGFSLLDAGATLRAV